LEKGGKGGFLIPGTLTAIRVVVKGLVMVSVPGTAHTAGVPIILLELLMIYKISPDPSLPKRGIDKLVLGIFIMPPLEKGGLVVIFIIPLSKSAGLSSLLPPFGKGQALTSPPLEKGGEGGF